MEKLNDLVNKGSTKVVVTRLECAYVETSIS